MIRPMEMQGFPTFCAGMIATGGGVDKAEEYEEHFARVARRMMENYATGLVMSDRVRGSSLLGPHGFMDWLKKNEGKTFPVKDTYITVHYKYTQPEYLYGTVDVTVQQVHVTEAWINKNSGAYVRMCMIEIDYDKSDAYDYTTTTSYVST